MPIIKQYIKINAYILFIKDKIKNAKDINNPPKAIIVLNPILYAILTPKESTENYAKPKIGNTIYKVDYVTDGSLFFI